jgi:hypothetical protein
MKLPREVVPQRERTLVKCIMITLTALHQGHGSLLVSRYYRDVEKKSSRTHDYNLENVDGHFDDVLLLASVVFPVCISVPGHRKADSRVVGELGKL